MTIKFEFQVPKDVRNFARLVNITHPSKGKIPLEPYDYQLGLLKRYQNNPLNLVKHGRQVGTSMINNIYALWFAMKYSNVTVVITSNRMLVNENSLICIKNMYSDLIDSKKICNATYNKSNIVFDNGSKIIAKPFSADIVQGMNVSLFICDDFNYIHDRLAREFFQNSFSRLSAGRIILSSSNVYNSTLFNEMFYDSQKEISQFKAFNIKGNRVPNRDYQWETKMVEQMGLKKFMEEFNY